MPIASFPDPRETEPDGIVAVGGDLNSESLLMAYRNGIFPWPDPSFPMMIWACPEERAILEFDLLHVPRSLERAKKKTRFRFSFNEAFDQVIAECSAAYRPGQDGTWITNEMRHAYWILHKQGYAHSVEVWEGLELVAGLYGVSVDGTFAGESMFHKRPNASKLALLHLVEHLTRKGLTWMDIQQLTPHMAALGARELARNDFLDLLEQTRDASRKLF